MIYVATAVLVVTMLGSATLSAYAIYKYYSARSETYGSIPESKSSAAIQVTYTGKNYGFDFTQTSFNVDDPSNPYMEITYSPLDIDLTENYGIYVNDYLLSNTNKGTNFIEADYIVNFYKDTTDLQGGAVTGILHIKYIFNAKQTFVFFYANKSDYKYWSNYLNTDYFVVSLKTYTETEANIPTYTGLDLSTNLIYQTGSSASAKFTIYANKKSDYLLGDNYYALVNMINRNGGFYSGRLRVFVATTDNPIDGDFVLLKDSESNNSDFYTATCSIKTLATGTHTLTFLTVEYLGDYYLTQKWYITTTHMTDLTANTNYSILINNQINAQTPSITLTNNWGI